MENGKVQNSEFENGQVEFASHGPVLGFLNRAVQKQRKLLKASLSQESSRDSSTADSLQLQRYSFKITGYRVRESVEYQITLEEKRVIRGRVCSLEYQFTSRYSNLLRLHEQLTPAVKFPPKKFFNSKSPEFIAIRKKQLEEYLNEVAKEDNPTFEEFVKQIKKASSHAELRI